MRLNAACSVLLAAACLSGCAVPPHTARFNPPSLSKPNGYAHAVATTGGTTVYVSGQLPLTADGKLAGDDARAQVRQALENLKSALAASGASLNDVVKINVYLTNMDDLPAFREVRDIYFVGEPPASSLVQVSRLVRSDCRIEIDAVAVVR